MGSLKLNISKQRKANSSRDLHEKDWENFKRCHYMPNEKYIETEKSVA